ncbi:DUF397 domain-containing protein [Glycomyces sp. MUSA5-2]|uniref:DUF397 domain-containing protein n=1 Tax=Glycomyces sp. MUSA5-2 TaxID=2053002 RepID=UPI003008B484
MNRKLATPSSTSQAAGWRKSSRSADSGNGNCVEVRVSALGFEVRDSKLGASSPILEATRLDFLAMLTATESDHR